MIHTIIYKIIVKGRFLNYRDKSVSFDTENDFIKWDPNFSIGIPIIDEQHKKLVDLCKNLHNSILQNQSDLNGRGVFLSALKECINYVRVHFKVEEDLMQVSNYKNYAAHKARHKEFELEVSASIANINNITVIDALKFTKFLYDWILTHIAYEDKLYVPYVLSFLNEQKT